MNQVVMLGFQGEAASEASVTSAEMKEIEKRADEAGLSYYQMMENAGSGAAEYISREQEVSGKSVFVFCGKGNNGGDGFVVARKLKEKDALVTIVLLEGEPKTEDALKNFRICQTMDLPIWIFGDAGTEDLIKEAELIVDAVYGTGFHGELRDTVKRATRLINASGAATFALDIPSGLNGDSGEADQDTVKADATIVFHRLKPAHTFENCWDYCGQIVCMSIGIERVL